jgi:hypothetical protein
METEKPSGNAVAQNLRVTNSKSLSSSSSHHNSSKAAVPLGNSFWRVIKFMQAPPVDGAIPTKAASEFTSVENHRNYNHTDWLKKKALEDMAQDIKARVLHWQQLDSESQQIVEQMLNAALSRGVDDWRDLPKNKVVNALAQKVNGSMYAKWLGGRQGIYLEGRGLAAQFFKNSTEALSVPSLLHTIGELKKESQENLPLSEEKHHQLVLP